jgi:pimeloyl-ACP methyl ester carboxylesterase
MKTSADGLTIAYDDRGGDEPALLCLPGWCAGRSAFDKLQPRQRLLALDWRGHGGSDKPDGDFGEAELLHDALAVIAASGARQVVPLATAHAGWLAIELFRTLGKERIPKLVLVDWIVGAAPPPFLAALAAMRDPAKWQAARDQLFALWLEGVDNDDVIRFVRDDMGSYDGEMWARASREIAGAYARFGSPLEELTKLQAPTLHLHSLPTHPAAEKAEADFAAAHSWYQVRRLDARSHFPTLEVPRLVDEAVAAFV